MNQEKARPVQPYSRPFSEEDFRRNTDLTEEEQWEQSNQGETEPGKPVASKPLPLSELTEN